MTNSYENCVSLGWYCGVAASMSKVGVRDFSGPFDWYWSDYKSVIELIDNGFDDFFARENLEPDSEKPKVFEDKKYGFRCFHDVKTDLDSDYDEIRARYQRRADRFLDALHRPTCLFRAVRSVDEIKYITENTDYIDSVVKRYNDANTVVYLLNESLVGNCGDRNGSAGCGITSPRYIVPTEYLCDAYGVRALFDGNAELLEFCSGLIPKDRIELNREHYSRLNSTCASEVYHAIREKDESVVGLILDRLETSVEEGLYLWGFGYHGRILYKFLCRNGVRVIGVVDKNASAADGIRESGAEYLSPENLAEGSRAFVSIADEEASAEVMEKLRTKGCKCATYKDLF